MAFIASFTHHKIIVSERMAMLVRETLVGCLNARCTDGMGDSCEHSDTLTCGDSRQSDLKLE